MDPKWYHVCWPRLTAKRVEPVVSISWASCWCSLCELQNAVMSLKSSLNRWLWPRMLFQELARQLYPNLVIRNNLPGNLPGAAAPDPWTGTRWGHRAKRTSSPWRSPSCYDEWSTNDQITMGRIRFWLLDLGEISNDCLLCSWCPSSFSSAGSYCNCACVKLQRVQSTYRCNRKMMRFVWNVKVELSGHRWTCVVDEMTACGVVDVCLYP